MALRFKVGEHARVAYIRRVGDNPFTDWAPGVEVVVKEIGPFPSNCPVHTPQGIYMIHGDADYMVMTQGGFYNFPMDCQLIKLTDPDAGIEQHEDEEITA